MKLLFLFEHVARELTCVAIQSIKCISIKTTRIPPPQLRIYFRAQPHLREINVSLDHAFGVQTRATGIFVELKIGT